MKVNPSAQPRMVLSLALASTALAINHAGGAHADFIANFTGADEVVLAGLKVSNGRIAVAAPTVSKQQPLNATASGPDRPNPIARWVSGQSMRTVADWSVIFAAA